MRRVIFIHGNGTLHWSGSWAGWLKEQLDHAGYSSVFETFPDSINARAEYWLEFLENHLHVGEEDLIVGWSSGAVAAMRYAENHRILGSILISPSITDLDDEMEKLSGWYTTPCDWDKIKNNQDKIALFYSDNDPFIPQNQFEEVSQQVSPKVYCLAGRKHFIEDTTFPEVLDYIKENYD